MEHKIKLFPKNFFAVLGFYKLTNTLLVRPGDIIVIECLPEPPANAPSQFHIDRGCCDGTDLAKCFEARQIIVEKVVDKPKKVATVKITKPARFCLD